MLTANELSERIRRFRILEERGLVVRHQQEDGSALLTFPQGEDHPEIVAFQSEIKLQ